MRVRHVGVHAWFQLMGAITLAHVAHPTLVATPRDTLVVSQGKREEEEEEGQEDEEGEET